MDIPIINSYVNFLSEGESQNLADLIRKRNVFSRHSWENDFYVQRARDLANNTVIVVTRTGDANSISNEGEKVADVIEKLALLSTTLVMSRKKIHRQLGINPHHSPSISLTIDKKFYLKSRSKSERDLQGITIDEKFCRRFKRCGFPRLTRLAISNNDIAERVRSAINWVFESRLEPLLEASAVKTSIALESLLISSESEPLAKTLSERAAFILSSDPDVRSKVSAAVKRFYNVRSGVVHGSKNKRKELTPNLVEGMDRLIVLLCLIIASNTDRWESTKSLVGWCEKQKWTAPTDVLVPFSNTYINNAIAYVDRKGPSN